MNTFFVISRNISVLLLMATNTFHFSHIMSVMNRVANLVVDSLYPLTRVSNGIENFAKS